MATRYGTGGGGLEFVTLREPGRKPSLEQLKQIIDQEIRSSIGYVGGETSEDRRRAMEYYLAEPFGNEIEGRSQIVSSDVQDVIESMMPDFMEIFAGSDRIVRFKGRGEGDDELASQATDYVNYVWMQDNDGYGCIHDWIKDGLLQKNGILKVYWEETDKVTRETLENVNSLHLQELMADESIEIIEANERLVDPTDEIVQFAPDGLLYDITLLRTEPEGRIRLYCLPPEEFLISRRSIGLDDASFTCHKVKKTISDLIEEGYDPKELEDVPSHDIQDFNEERVARFPEDDEWPDWENNLDPSMRELWLYECYIKLDYDGDNVAEMNQVITAGRGHWILTNPKSGEKVTPVDDHPFSTLTPIRMPHKFFGRSMADLTMDLQLIKSTVERQWMDNVYNINNNRAAINELVDLDSYLHATPGQPILVEGDRNPGDSIEQIDTTPLHGYLLPLLEYLDTTREERTGTTRLDQGLDPESLNKTATGMNLMLGRTQKRKLMMARLFAETGFKVAMRKTLKLLIQHQDRPRMIRLRDTWIEMDPRGWDADMDIEINIGLGHGTNQDKMNFLSQIGVVMEKFVTYQGSLNGPLVTWDNAFHYAEQITEAAGLPSVAGFFTKPEGDMEEPPDPAQQEVQGKLQIEQMRLQIDQQKDQGRLQLQAKEHEDKMALRRYEVESELQLKREQVAGQLQVEREKAVTVAQVETQKAAAQIDVEREKAAANMQVQREKAEQDAEVKREANRLQAEVTRPKTRDLSFSRDGEGNVTGAKVEDAAAARKEEVSELARSIESLEANLQQDHTSLEQLSQSMVTSQQQMAQALSELSAAVRVLGGPKRVIRENGKVVGVESVGG